jgi:hypothetical protein
MRKLTLLITITLFCAFNISNAQTITKSYSFENPEIISNEEGFVYFEYSNCINYAEEGEPLMPHLAIDLLMPQGEIIKSVKITSISYTDVINDIKILPASKPFPISQKTPENYRPIPNPKIYSSNNVYPLNAIESISTQFLSGHPIGSFSICPIQYFPAQNQVKFIKSISIEVETATDNKAQSALKFLQNTPLIEKRIKQIVDNPEMLANYTDNYFDNEIDILLITKNSFIAAFEDFVNFKKSTGYIIKVESTEDIYSNYEGQDNQEKIRNCVIDYYENHGITFVILGGDADPNNSSHKVIPHRGFAADDDDDIPSDMYYSCLDGTWNDDGDNKWGESGETDLYAEVGIGRICVDNDTEIENFTNKLILYQSVPVVDDIENALMLGEELNNNPWTYGGDYMDEIIEGSYANGVTTVGFADNFSISKLYDRDGGWNKYNVFNKINNDGVHLMNHLGHSYVQYNMKMDNSDLNTSNFQNDGITRSFVIGYSQGCYNGSFDNRETGGNYTTGDCFAEKITTIATAEVACVANSRYGWYSPGGTGSTSQFVHRQFCDAIFGEEIFVIGYINSDSKEDNAVRFNSSGNMRWVVYETNLFGDPSLDIWTAIPTEIIATYPDEILIGMSEIAVQTDAPFARIALIQDNEIIGRTIAGDDGNAVVSLFEYVTSTSPVTVSVIAHNRIQYTGSISVVANQPYVTFESLDIVEISGNNNGVVDFGESISLNVSLINIGEQPTNSAMVTLSTDNNYITITDATENFGSFEAGQSIQIENAFAFDVASIIPDGEAIQFNLEVVGESTWNSNFEITANAPLLICGAISINDNGGNSNGLLDPGETVDLVISAINNGHTACSDVTASVSPLSGFLTINTSDFDLDILEVGEEKEAIFSVTVNETIPIGISVGVLFEIISGGYSAENEYGLKVGQIIEDFEEGDFSQFNWSFVGNADWTITQSNAYDGIYCAESGNIGSNNTTSLMITRNAMADDSISFYKKVSSEPGYDFLRFYIDNSLIDQWSGEASWDKVSFSVSEGDHDFKWEYYKDANVSNGSDCGWIDNISFPATFTFSVDAGPDSTICHDGYYQCNATAVNCNSFMWSTLGTGTFDAYNTLNPIYTPSQEDIDDGRVILTITATAYNLEQKSNSLQINIITCTGVETISDDFDILIYPNPANSIVNLKANGFNETIGLKIYNSLGIVVYVEEKISLTNNSLVKFDLNELTSGIYFMVLEGENIRKTEKIRIQK